MTHERIIFETLQVSKIDAATAHFLEALRMFFSRRDPIVVHTLASAAHQVLADIGKGTGVKSKIREIPLPQELRKQWDQMINQAYNFFKHADRDSKNILSFRPVLTDWMLFDAAIMLEKLNPRTEKASQLFKAWFLLNHPEFVKDGVHREWLEAHRGEFKDKDGFLAELDKLQV